MQLILSIPLLIAVAFAAAAALLRLCGIEVQMIDPMTAGVIAAIAGMIGATPPLRQTGDVLGLVKAALVGTVLHLLVCIILTASAIGLNLVDARGRFLFWAVGGYWISILILIWLARRLVTARTLKAQH